MNMSEAKRTNQRPAAALQSRGRGETPPAACLEGGSGCRSRQVLRDKNIKNKKCRCKKKERVGV